MMTPFSGLFNPALACMLPALMGMVGALVIGGFIGWLFSPGPAEGSPAIQSEMAELRKELGETEEKLALAGSIMEQRQMQRDKEASQARNALENEMGALNRQVTELKMALVAAKRNVPAKTEKIVPDPAHIARIAQIEKEAARVPGLLKELEDLRKASPKAQKKAEPKKIDAGPTQLPKNVYRMISDSYGKRIAPDDLKLVEGIGPKIEAQLRKSGLKTWADVASAKPAQLQQVLDKAGERFQLHDPATWPEQCRMMMEHRWDELRKYQRKHSSAR